MLRLGLFYCHLEGHLYFSMSLKGRLFLGGIPPAPSDPTAPPRTYAAEVGDFLRPPVGRSAGASPDQGH